MLTGAHIVVYSKDAEADRAFFKDTLGFRWVDAGFRGRSHTFSTKLSTTRFSPALSKAMVSLLPSTATTLPLPNF